LTTSVSNSYWLSALGFWLSASSNISSISSHTAFAIQGNAVKAFRQTARVRKELPFAGYSVVKELTRLWALGFWLWAYSH
jgi:hypothetical protein